VDEDEFFVDLVFKHLIKIYVLWDSEIVNPTFLPLLLAKSSVEASFDEHWIVEKLVLSPLLSREHLLGG
jgi:hypothetical protein